MRASYSALNTYKTCPLKYKFQELDKIRVPKGIEMVFGSAVHSALKYMFERTPLYPTLDEIIDFFRNQWDEKMRVFEDEEKKKAFYEEGISILKNFYKKNQPWNFNVIDLESRFELELEDSKSKEKHILTGIIDRIDKNPESDSYEIIDYKTAKRMPSQDIVDRDLQMSIYHMGLMKRWPHLSPDKIKLSLYFLKHNEKISTARSEERLEKTRKNIIGIINEIQGKITDNYNFPPTPSPLCDWCGYRQMCPMWKHLYTKSEIEIESIVKEYFELKDANQKNNERLDELKAIVYDFMNEQKVERIFGPEGYLTKKIQERVFYDMSKLPEDLKEKISTVKQFTTLTASKKKIEK